MTDSFQDQIIADFLAIRKFNKTAFKRGWTTEEEFDRAQDTTLEKYAGELCDGEWMDLVRAKLDLLEIEVDQDRVNEEFGYLGLEAN